jgi:hypothetical protein
MGSIEIAITVAGIMLSNVLLLLNKIKVFKGCCCEFETKEDDRVRTAKKWKDKLFPKTENKSILEPQTSLAISNVSTSPKHERRKHFRRRSLSLDKSYRKYRENSPKSEDNQKCYSTENIMRRKETSVVTNTVVTNISCADDDIIAVKTEHSVTEEQKTTDWTFYLYKKFNEKDFEEENENSPTNETEDEGTSIRNMQIKLPKSNRSKSMGDTNEPIMIYYVDMLNKVQRMYSYSEDELSNGVCIDEENGSPIIHITEIQII